MISTYSLNFGSYMNMFVTLQKETFKIVSALKDFLLPARRVTTTLEFSLAFLMII